MQCLSLLRAASLAVLVGFSALASGAPNTPILSESTATRAVDSALRQRTVLRGLTTLLSPEPRDLIDRALRDVRAVTTLEQLAVAPDGVVVSCPSAGTLTARLARGWPRVVRLQWNACASPAGVTLDGPGEVVLIGNSLFAEAVVGLRLGDGHSDLVRSVLRPPGAPIGSRVERRNLRLRGILPLARLEDDVLSPFRGSFLHEAVGFVQVEELRAELGPTGPSAEKYLWTIVTSTEGALVGGGIIDDAERFEEEYRLLAGTLTQRVDRPATPRLPVAESVTNWVRGLDLTVRLGRDKVAAREFFTIDGRLRSSIAPALGCAEPDTFTFRTRVPLTAHEGTSAFNDWLSAGELVINGSSVARFSTTGSQPRVDLVGHLALDVPGVASFTYDWPNIAAATLLPRSVCAP